MNIQTEIKQVADTLKSPCDDSDAIDIPIKRRVNFLCAQLKLCCVISDNGRRYTAELMQTAIELMLPSRSCYKAQYFTVFVRIFQNSREKMLL